MLGSLKDLLNDPVRRKFLAWAGFGLLAVVYLTVGIYRYDHLPSGRTTQLLRTNRLTGRTSIFKEIGRASCRERV